MGLSCSTPKKPIDKKRKGGFKFKFWKSHKRKIEVPLSLSPFELLPLEMYNEILIILEPEDRLVCRLLSSKFRYFVDSLFKFTLRVSDENISDFSNGTRFLCPESLRIGNLVHKTTSNEFHHFFSEVSTLHFIARTSRVNAQNLLCKHSRVKTLHLHTPFLAGTQCILRDSPALLEFRVFETLVHLCLSIEFIPPTLGQDWRVNILQNNLDDVLRRNFPSLETIDIKIVAGGCGEQFYFSFKRLCALLERHNQRLSTVFLEAPKLKPINVSSDLELPIIYSLLSRCHPDITFHITMGDSPGKTFAARNYQNRADFLSDVTEAVVKKHDKKILGPLFHAFTDAEPLLSYDL